MNWKAGQWKVSKLKLNGRKMKQKFKGSSKSPGTISNTLTMYNWRSRRKRESGWVQNKYLKRKGLNSLKLIKHINLGIHKAQPPKV